MADEKKPGEPAPAKPAEVPAEKPAEKPAETPAAPPPVAAKPDGAGEKPASTEGAPAPKAPEKYSLAVPEGDHEWIDADYLKTFEASMREGAYSNEEAQEILTKELDTLKTQDAAFRTQVQTYPVYGGDHYPDTERYVRLALDKLRPEGTPRGDGLRALLRRSGFANHLEVMSLFADLGKQWAEDTPPRGASGGGGGKDIAELLYGGSMGKTSP